MVVVVHVDAHMLDDPVARSHAWGAEMRVMATWIAPYARSLGSRLVRTM